MAGTFPERYGAYILPSVLTFHLMEWFSICSTVVTDGHLFANIGGWAGETHLFRHSGNIDPEDHAIGEDDVMEDIKKSFIGAPEGIRARFSETDEILKDEGHRSDEISGEDGDLRKTFWLGSTERKYWLDSSELKISTGQLGEQNTSQQFVRGRLESSNRAPVSGKSRRVSNRLESQRSSMLVGMPDSFSPAGVPEIISSWQEFWSASREIQRACCVQLSERWKAGDLLRDIRRGFWAGHF
ncbi:hypothetical protein Nepgr_002934 [Nepenthes gracilis]|uniref:Uncharacterized protein n=1 Tax=Nepenthes gracilis TaxID=150966 RepID=A0AAD3P4G9_NEPGR|nr:hypothetical protein Nepgr_002934 [Nepenthes gracilis]